MSILINESHGNPELWLSASSPLIASYSETPTFLGLQKPVQNVPLRLGSVTFPYVLTRGCMATGWININNLLTQSVAGTLYITTSDTGANTNNSRLTINLAIGFNTFNISSLQCGIISGSVVYIYFIPTSVITDTGNNIRASASTPISIAYSSMPSNAWTTSTSGSPVGLWIKAI